MTRAETPEEPNALAWAIGLLGDEWTLMILRYALLDVTRYTAFAAAMPISNAVLTNRLDLLVREGLFERRTYQQHPVRAEYVLTPRGRSVWPVLTAIWAWELKWVPQHRYATPPMIHLVCGQEMAPRFCCASCGEVVPATALKTAWGPSGGWRRSVPAVRTRRRSPRGDAPSTQSTFYPDTMAVFGNRWSASVVGAAFRGVRRFTDFQDLLGAPPSLLADRLASLCARGILQADQRGDRPDWAEYRLTEKGLDFFPIVSLAVQWADHWYAADEGPVMDWIHATCGATFRGVLTCDRCDRPLTGADIGLDGTG